ncbi:heme/hemin ABC transporter substrate-binding protein [Sediminivirga luteola]|uniref:ABC transporter substrate-binding protein n=1 Tax=Sediminivirga luteola TaxID=1774748 RepID=A0A8J2XKB3_9MICO|nr:ABC transporter substrate-binding protein [Sediminivirga luteola]GGA26765.1 ABC transporter substrate-binding protein [Sediminivirga luteola]
MPLPRVLRRFKRSTVRRFGWTAGAVAAAMFLWVNGFHNIGTIDTASAAECAMPEPQTAAQEPDVPDVNSGDLTPPREITGPTTAYTRTSAIPPVTTAPEEVQRLPVTVGSADGPEQTVTDTTRILALNQNGGLAAAAIGLGFGCNLIGRDIATNYPALMPGNDDIPLVTQNGHELNAEAILNLSPTVVLTDSTVGPYDVQLQLREAGIPVIMAPVVYEGGVEAVGEQLRFVARALGVPDVGEALAERTQDEINGTIQAIGKMAPSDPEEKPRVVFLYLRGSIYYWFGIDSGADSIIQAISARDVATEVGFEGMSPTNAEALIKASPDVIIVMTLGLASVGGLDEALELPGIKQTPAGRNQRIVDMSDYEVMSFGPRTASVLAALATAIYAPELSYQPDTPPEAIDRRLREIEQEREEES